MHSKTLLVAALAAGSQAATMNLTSLIASTSQLSGLATLLKAYPNITSALGNATNVTLFAPANSALDALTSSGVLQSAGGSTIMNLLDYHVLPGVYYASNVTSTPAFPHTTLNSTTYTNVTGGQVVECRLLDNTTVQITSGLKQVANVTTANLNFTGGVVHVIDSVLTIPEDCATTALDANLTALLGALQATNLTDAILGLKDITVFAPSNDAFQAIGSAAGNLSTAQLTQILEYHVINGTVAYSSDVGNGTVTTLGGKNLTLTVESGAIFVDGARVINPDLLTANGVIHVIDAVLNPNNTSVKPNPTASTAAVAFSGASSGSDVPLTSGISAATTTVTALVATTLEVASGYKTVTAGAVATSAVKASSSSKAAAAPLQTGAMGAAALFGGAAVMANW